MYWNMIAVLLNFGLDRKITNTPETMLLNYVSTVLPKTAIYFVDYSRKIGVQLES